jgi:rubredoxin
MVRKPIIKINLPGGIASAGDLLAVMEAAEKAKVEDAQFGIRQQLYLKPNEKHVDELKAYLDEAQISYEENENSYPNIISSYVGEDVFDNANWLSEGVYTDILDQFDFKPRLKINLVEGNQSFVPFFTGNINFISAPLSNYWYLYVRFPKTNRLYCWKAWIYSFDIPRISKLIEDIIFENRELFYENDEASGDTLYTIVHAKENFVTQSITEELLLPNFALPYYEGFNRYANKTWLGIYRRDELFPVAFLKEVCLICRKTKIGQLYITPWKSLIIKGIDSADRKLWDLILGKYRINVRHASNELNWQVEDLSEEALTLKRYIIRHFDRDDVRTYGLCFAIKTGPKTGLFGSVIIRKKENGSHNQRRALDRYDILYTRDFKPNSKEVVLFRKDVEKENLGVYLVSLCKYFYEQQNEADTVLHHIYSDEEVKAKEEANKIITVYQCRHCLSIYDENYGDESNNISPQTSFIEVAASYECPVCNAPKEDFMPMEKGSNLYAQTRL